MKRFFKLLVIVLCVSMFTPSVVPHLGVERVEAAQKVKLNYTKKTIYEGKSFTLKVSGTKKKVKWSSSNKKVATVSSKGVVKGKSGGNDKKTCKITASVGGKKYVCKVTVKALPKEEDDEDTDDGKNSNEDENDNASENTPTSDVAKNIALLKEEIQKNGYTNANGSKTIRGMQGNFTPIIVYDKKTDLLEFSLISQGDIIFFMSFEITSQDNSAPINVSYTCAGKGSSFTAIGTIIPSEYSPDKGCYFTFKSNNSTLSESDIQEVSNSTLKLAFTSWSYTIEKNTSLTMKDIGFTEIKDFGA